ncbi:MAG: hypothetical protein C0600_04765 [Ignavibacteria bacterium]|nr:MAG: hypothetical protein C0600_04765 [Ignavibacteria bacterium]
MSLQEYGVWKGKAVRVTAETADDDPHSPHIHLFYEDGTGGEYSGSRRASINVKSGSSISELVVWINTDFQHPITGNLEPLEQGFTSVESAANGLALDYIRSNVVNFEDGHILPHDIPGAENDVLDLVLPLLENAVQRQAVVYLFGEPYLPSRQGIHDVHMNQGSVGQFTKYNGAWQDGGLIITNSDGTYTAILIAFASQAAHTDESTGNALPGSQNLKDLISGAEEDHDSGDDHIEPDTDSSGISDDLRVAIIGALVNPIGPENTPQHTGRHEAVLLLNRSPESVNLRGWSVLNRMEKAQPIADEITLAPGALHAVTMAAAPLSNKGGLITLLDENGLKVDGVSYTKKQAKEEGYIILFR